MDNRGKKLSLRARVPQNMKETVPKTAFQELQCSDWSHRPLTEEHKLYAATDAHCLLQIFNVFKSNLVEEITSQDPKHTNVGLKDILNGSDHTTKIVTAKLCKAADVIRAMTQNSQNITNGVKNDAEHDENLLKIVRKYGEKIMLNLKESDLLPRISKKRSRRRGASSKNVNTDKHLARSTTMGYIHLWAMMAALGCDGIDAAVPPSKKPDSRELLGQALKENRVLLTRDTKLLRHQDLAKHQIYRVKILLKNEQLLEVIETFQLKISENQLMSRCTKCNGKFIQKPLTIEEAIEAAKGFQRIPNCLFNKNLSFGSYHNEVQKFMDSFMSLSLGLVSLVMSEQPKCAL
ncbi:LOW QUALITY PROTEIN: hypothetical protein HID58_049661 [Brassica napus]|uniref:Mut7-C RNAse domain-containing protein n=1 Tax=Brassica napus TaxID=3708 RepID=A0ABQ8B5U9_BRANA|nr:LOW QUALITY PROTEIN: hypothetical protein HID58_049661 [Brassica napus]